MNIPKPTSLDIAISGLRAEALRMNVAAENIANSGTTRTVSGDVYRRRMAVLSTGDDETQGVSIGDVVQDFETELKRVLDPGHPDADADGYVQMPNVNLPAEMVGLVESSRAYQANAAVVRRYVESVETALELLK